MYEIIFHNEEKKEERKIDNMYIDDKNEVKKNTRKKNHKC